MSSEEEWKFYMVESCKIGPIFTEEKNPKNCFNSPWKQPQAEPSISIVKLKYSVYV